MLKTFTNLKKNHKNLGNKLRNIKSQSGSDTLDLNRIEEVLKKIDNINKILYIIY